MLSHPVIRWGGIGVALLLLINMPIGTGAQGRRPMTLVDVVQLPRILDAQLAPDGRSVLYMLNRADWKANRQMPHLWKQEIAGGPPRQLTFSENGESGGRWSPDG